ncbi:MAG: terminase gpA endonuclease subunit, partial [Acidimicrobiales bacterium]
PDHSGLSRIERDYEASDQRRFFVPCPHCGAMQWLKFDRLRWQKGQPETAEYHCEGCDKPIAEHHKTAMLEAGEWRATADAADPNTVGYHLSALYSPIGWLSWERIVRAWDAAQGSDEAIKAFRHDVDVLTLTASPIPRTLEMSLTGIRDMSMLSTAPADRRPILTYVGEYDERAVAEALRRELLREGQVFFVHNRVMDIDHVAARLRELVPEARVAVAHGQMDESSLEQVVVDFWEGRFDVLVCTTIIESGIDMPTVNTLVVDRADLLGLGQLHQLRGRVGRAGQRAYAYLFHPVDRVLTEEAYERLRTIGDATELGSGFRIAMRDLEIRGAGNLLGESQSGHIAAVGYDLYCQMVTEAVAELKGETVDQTIPISIEVPGDAHLPDDYVPMETSRLEAYRRLASVRTREELDDVRAEWQDRFGPVPSAAEALLEVARLRVECARTGIAEITVIDGPGLGGPDHVARLSPVHLPSSRQVRLERKWSAKGHGNQAVYKEAVAELQLPLRRRDGPIARQLVAAIADLVPDLSSSAATGTVPGS